MQKVAEDMGKTGMIVQRGLRTMALSHRHTVDDRRAKMIS